MTDYYYHVYGLYLKSSLYFPELIAKKSIPNVLIHSNNYESLLLGFTNHKMGIDKLLFSSNDVIYFLDKFPLFRVRNGKEIIINPKHETQPLFLRSLLLGIGLGTLLMQRGNLVLHASSINMNGKAIAFMGCCGEGKSTLATLMTCKGYPFICDDILPIHLDNENKIIAYPAFPHTKLDDEIIKLLPKSSISSQLHPEVDKHFYNVTQNFSTNSLPLKTIYVLEEGIKNEIIKLNIQDSFLELIKNSYAFNLFRHEEKTENFLQCSELAKKIPVKKLRRTKSVDEISNIIHIIEEDNIWNY